MAPNFEPAGLPCGHHFTTSRDLEKLCQGVAGIYDFSLTDDDAGVTEQIICLTRRKSGFSLDQQRDNAADVRRCEGAARVERVTAVRCRGQYVVARSRNVL